MAKKITGMIKLQIPAGKANPSPPVGPALGQHGVNIMEFCKAFNAKTQGEDGMITPVVIGFLLIGAYVEAHALRAGIPFGVSLAIAALASIPIFVASAAFVVPTVSE